MKQSPSLDLFDHPYRVKKNNKNNNAFHPRRTVSQLKDTFLNNEISRPNENKAVFSQNSPLQVPND